MKQNIHPDYQDMTVTCACGNSFVVGGTSKALRVEVCNKCHPFFTGTQKFIDALGRVDKFIAKRNAAVGYVKKGKNAKGLEDKTPKSLKEMLEVKKAADKKAAEAAATEAVSE